ncbi:hypothetical protein GCM10007876_41880 [Litoribrevibacter albus]|uniref:Uncharacterized protein n=1 Tax=Litoribrevibacter albus TaxID=1473156 RepID=A0AA37SFF1_9GAMM|nr:hypothetical protein GCM10007876_41880 [Litoribrevibacter albus]
MRNIAGSRSVRQSNGPEHQTKPLDITPMSADGECSIFSDRILTELLGFIGILKYNVAPKIPVRFLITRIANYPN